MIQPMNTYDDPNQLPATPGNNPEVMPELVPGVPATPGNNPSVMPELVPGVPATPGNNPSVMPELVPGVPATPGNNPSVMPTLPGPPIQGGIIIPGFPNQPPANQYCNIRLLHAGVNQPSVNVTIGTQQAAEKLTYGNVTPYYLEPAGRKLITVTSSRFPRLVLASSVLNFADGDIVTVVIVNARNGIALFPVYEQPCNNPVGQSCLKVANVSYNCPPANILLSNGRLLFTNVRFQDVTDYAPIRPGSYRLLATETILCEQPPNSSNSVCYGRLNVLFTTPVNLAANQAYTLYILGNAYGSPGLQGLLLESYLGY